MRISLTTVVFILALTYFVNLTTTTAWRKRKLKYMHQPSTQREVQRQPNKKNVIQPRLVGGRPAAWGEAPYYLRLEIVNHGFHCGACLMNYRGLRFAVTAAHCVWVGAKNQTDIWKATRDPSQVYLVGSDVDKDVHQPREQIFHAFRILIHHEYDPQWFANDIALIILKEYAHENLGLERIPGPGLDWKDPQFAQIYGHGAKLRFDVQRYLQVIELKIFERGACTEALTRLDGIDHTLLDSEFCLQHPSDWIRQGTCYGDSGGPVVAFNYTLQRWYLAGIVSFREGHACGAEDSLSVVQKVTHFVPWMETNLDIWIESFGTGNPHTNGKPDNTNLTSVD